MTNDELEHIQVVCRGWLRRADTAGGSQMTIPAGGALSRTVEVTANALLTFDNVLVLSAVDAENGVCYTKRIGRQGEPGEFIDTPLATITAKPTPTDQEPPAPLRATQKRYRDAMERLAETQRREANENLSATVDLNSWSLADADDQERPKFLLYTKDELLGYSLLERTRSNGQRSGRFHPSDDYFVYAEIFAAFPAAENDCFEANAREAYELFDEKSDEYRTRFNELSTQIDSLKLYVTDEAGSTIAASEVRLEDLSRHYDDQNERWLHVTVEPDL